MAKGNGATNVVPLKPIELEVPVDKRKIAKGKKGGHVAIHVNVSVAQPESANAHHQDQYRTDDPMVNLSTGHVTINLPANNSGILTKLSQEKSLPADIIRELMPDEIDMRLAANACCTIIGDEKTSLALFKKGAQPEQDQFVLVSKAKKSTSKGICPINDEQAFAFALLADPSIPLVTLSGRPGSGKTLMALLASYKLRDEFDKTLIWRPVEVIGKGLGFLPGDLQEKWEPYTKPIVDNLHLIYGDTPKSDQRKDGVDFNPVNELMKSGHIEIMPPSFALGWTGRRTMIIIDECQNLSETEIKALITRCGEGSKVVLTGDCNQVHNRSLTRDHNGLAHVIRQMHDQPLHGHIKMTICVRHPLAALADELL